MMRVLVTGRSGQVVTALAERAGLHGAEIVAVGRPELDLTDPRTIEAALTGAAPDLIVSAAAYTAVDRAESEEALAHTVNAVAAGEIARVAGKLGLPVVHLSTDYVFEGSGTRPHAEEDETGPLGVYGRTKLAGEQAVRAGSPDHVILRTSWVYSPFGGNFVRTMLRLAADRPQLRVVDDQFGAPTSALDIADAVLTIAARLHANRNDPDLRGTYHLSGSGEANWAEFAREIFMLSGKLGGPVAAVQGIPTSEYPTPARRPLNSRLSTQKLEAVYGIVLPDWRASTREVVARLLIGSDR